MWREFLRSYNFSPVSAVNLRRLGEGLSAPTATKAVAALQKAATFQDVRARLADCFPSAVMPLVELLRLETSDKDSRERNTDQEMYLKDEKKVNRSANEAVGMMPPPPEHLKTEVGWPAENNKVCASPDFKVLNTCDSFPSGTGKRNPSGTGFRCLY